MQRPLKLIMPITGFVLLAALVAPVGAESVTVEALQRELQRQSERIERLERAVQTLQAHPGRPAPAGSRLDDPLLGTWQCTNQVLTYGMTFFADGLLLQESTTFGPMRELAWSRIATDEILLTGNVRMRTSMSGRDRMMVENLQNQAKWECRKVVD